jgi:signal transduction histidine kinase
MTRAELHAAFASLPQHGLYAFVFNTGVAIILAAAPFAGGFFPNFVYSQCIGLSAWLLIDVPRRLLWRDQRPPLVPMIALSSVALLCAALGGSWLAAAWLGHPGPFSAGRGMTVLLIPAVAGLFAVTYFYQRGTALHMEAAAAREKSRAETIERQVAEAKLRLLQAQIEPHFLFNTLANVHALIPLDGARAQQMLGHLDGFLRAALAAARKEHNTLADEFALLRSYLEILAIRMGPRLAFTLSLPNELADLKMPPMLLQPLVENAIKHGLEPKIEGGRVDIACEIRNQALVVTIEDTGLGLGASSSNGSDVGLAHVRERLAALYGDAGALKMENSPSGGATVTVKIPAGR